MRFFWPKVSLSTEMPVKSGIFWPKRKPPVALVDPVAFAIALIAPPIITGVVGMPLLFIPTVGAVLGAPAYLLIGAPLLWRALRHGMASSGDFAGLGFKINFIGGLILVPLVMLWAYMVASANDLGSMLGVTLFMWALACAHGAVWCGLFGNIYSALRNRNFPSNV